MIVAAYIRVSTDEQATEGNSLSEQTERLYAYCKAMNWPEPKIYKDDGYSAKDMNRKDLKRLLVDVENKKVNKVMVTKLDRISRKLLDLLNMIDLFQKHDVSFVSVSEQFDTNTPAGRLTLQVLGAVAEFERERISERVKDNMMSLALNTDKAITNPCYGYDVVDGKFVINEEEAEGVELMAQLAEQGYGYRMIAKVLNDNGYKTKKGAAWDQVNVKRLIRNPAIAGTMVYNMRTSKNGKRVLRDKTDWVIKEDNHPAIIEKERHDRIMAILDSRKPARKHADSETYLLTGLIKCGHCGRNMKGATARVRRPTGSYDYYRYICSSYTLGYGCKYHAVHRDDLEAEIIRNINELASTSNKETDIDISPSAVTYDEIEELKSQLAKINRRIQKQIEAYSDDLITAEDLKTATERAEKEREEIKIRLESAMKRKASVDDVKNTAKSLLGEITGDDRSKAKVAIRKLIEKIEILDGHVIHITWRSLV